jgi:regulator of nucleoside diphosphate kinase
MQIEMETGLDELKRSLQREASGRVQELKVEPSDDGVIVHCRSRNYYGLQVILAALNEFARTDPLAARVCLRAEINGQRFDLPIERTGVETRTKTRCPTMADRKIVITETDVRRLSQMLASEFAAAIVPRQYLNDLRFELERAEIVADDEVPDDVVTMNSTVVLRDLDTGEQETFTLVYPQKANIAKNKLSVIAPVGTAILGYRVGDVVRWKVPDGDRRLQIEEVLCQPERASVLQF